MISLKAYTTLSTTTLAVTMLAAAFSPAHAECANHPGQPRPRVCAEFYYSDAVFEGTVVSTRQVPEAPSDPANIMGWFYTIEITKAYRGLEQRTVEIYAGNDETGVPMQHGHTYVMFVKRTPRGLLSVNSCGSTGEIEKSAETLAFLKKLMDDRKISTQGEIGGRIVAVAPGSISLSEKPVARVQVIARSVDKSFSDITDDQGRFHISVPSGTYSVTTKTNAWSITPYVLSYAKPEKVVIENAGCADLEFLAQPPK